MHFAGLKAVGESCEKPLLYYKNNVGGTMNLLEVKRLTGPSYLKAWIQLWKKWSSNPSINGYFLLNWASGGSAVAELVER